MKAITAAAPRVYLEERLSQEDFIGPCALEQKNPQKFEIKPGRPDGWPEFPELAARNNLKNEFAPGCPKAQQPKESRPRGKFPRFGTVLVMANLILVPLLFALIINYA